MLCIIFAHLQTEMMVWNESRGDKISQIPENKGEGSRTQTQLLDFPFSPCSLRYVSGFWVVALPRSVKSEDPL